MYVCRLILMLEILLYVCIKYICSYNVYVCMTYKYVCMGMFDYQT